MKILSTLCLAAAAATAHAQTVVDADLAARDPQFQWLPGFDPAHADLFAHNAITINAPCEVVWARLADARRWPSWYANSADVQVGPDGLRAGLTFDWKTFGLAVTSHVVTFEPSRSLAWTGHTAHLDAQHAWLLLPEGASCRVVTEEVAMGPDARAWRREQPAAMHDGHEAWLQALKKVAEAAR